MSEDHSAAIKAALSKMDKGDDGDWTQGGLPSVDRIKNLSGIDTLTRGQITEAAPGLNRENFTRAAFRDTARDDTSSDGEPALNSADKGRDEEAADQAERAAEQEPQPVDIAKQVKNPIVLIEAAISAMNSDERYRKNGELQNFLRGYYVAQLNIRAHQDRLDKRHAQATG